MHCNLYVSSKILNKSEGNLQCLRLNNLILNNLIFSEATVGTILYQHRSLQYRYEIPYQLIFSNNYRRNFCTFKNEIRIVLLKVKVKLKLSLYRPWRTLGLREVEAPSFSDIRLTDGGKVVSTRRRPLFTPRNIPCTHFCYRLSQSQGLFY
jgi:hypothetical protein